MALIGTALRANGMPFLAAFFISFRRRFDVIYLPYEPVDCVQFPQHSRTMIRLRSATQGTANAIESLLATNSQYIESIRRAHLVHGTVEQLQIVNGSVQHLTAIDDNIVQVRVSEMNRN